jgi:hypothetical protein
MLLHPLRLCSHCLTGYFTTRPASKAYIRGATSYLQAARQVEVLAGQRLGWSRGASTEILEEAVALTQHHDAITGTEKQHVANDYHKRLARGSIPSQTSSWPFSQFLLFQALASLPDSLG